MRRRILFREFEEFGEYGIVDFHIGLVVSIASRAVRDNSSVCRLEDAGDTIPFCQCHERHPLLR